MFDWKIKGKGVHKIIIVRINPIGFREIIALYSSNFHVSQVYRGSIERAQPKVSADGLGFNSKS